MNALSIAECESWCAARGIPSRNARFQFGDPNARTVRIDKPKLGLDLVALGNVLTDHVGESGHVRTLLWLTDWGMWSEAYDEVGVHLWQQLLQSYGVSAPMRDSSGIAFEAPEGRDQRVYLTIALLFQWDLAVLPEHANYTLFASHDGHLLASCRNAGVTTTLLEALGPWGPSESRSPGR